MRPTTAPDGYWYATRTVREPGVPGVLWELAEGALPPGFEAALSEGFCPLCSSPFARGRSGHRWAHCLQCDITYSYFIPPEGEDQ